jgi:hypothetical protein
MACDDWELLDQAHSWIHSLEMSLNQLPTVVPVLDFLVSTWAMKRVPLD